MVNAVRDLNRVQYAGLDFDTHSDDLLARMQVEFAADFNDFALSSLGIVLLDLVAFGLDTLSFYLDRRATDQFLETARTRSSVSRLTRQLGYKMTGAVASATDLVVAIVSPVGFPVTLDQNTQFQGPNGLIFESSKPITFDANSGPTDSQFIPVFEGETIQETFISDGTANQVFELARVPSDKFVVEGSVIVTVDLSPWDESDFISFDKTDQYEFAPNDDPPTVRFGDGTAGNIPVQGAEIKVTYVASKGLQGLVQANTITSTVAPVVEAFQTIQLSIDNPEPSVGGDDAETLEHAKIFAPQVFKSRMVAVTRGDYEALAGSFADPLFGRVAVAQAISSKTGETDLTLQNLLSDITDAVGLAKPTIDAAVAAGTAALDTIDDATTNTPNTNSADVLDDLEDAMVEINNQNTTISSQARTGIRDLLTISSSVSSIDTLITPSVNTDADAIISALNDTLRITPDPTNSVAEPITINSSILDPIEALAESIKRSMTTLGTETTAISGAEGDADTAFDGILSASGQITDKAVDEIGVDLVTTGRFLTFLSTNNIAVQTNTTSARTEFTNISNAQVVVVADVQTAVDEITQHVGGFLSSDCKANLVTVPILTKDAGGFFAAPSTSLVQSLQIFLDERKEVTQVVSVTSGERFLIPAVITVRVGVAQGNALNAVQKAVEAAVDTVLRDRAFGQSLFESELDAAVEAVAGVKYWNVSIEGHFDTSTSTTLTGKLDSSGNLIVGIGEIITKATEGHPNNITLGVVVTPEPESTTAPQE
jgi:hypothetical protein